MNVAPFTVSRWESGASSPTGLQEEVLRALYNKAVELKKANDDDGAKIVGGLVALGIGALIFYLLKDGA